MHRYHGPPLHMPPPPPPVPFHDGWMMPPPYVNEVVPPPNLLSRLFGMGRVFQGGGQVDFATLLANAQRALQLTNQAMPLIRQYGPIIRNLPTIWRILREPDHFDEDEAEEVPFEREKKEEKVKKEAKKPKRETIDGLPLPKLYI